MSLVISVAPVYAQAEPRPVWATYGLLVNDTPGNTPQQNPKIISDGQGEEYIIVWEDGRSGYYDIYVQKIDGAGKPRWEKNGVAACRFPGNQNFASAAKDGAGGAFIVWQDYRNGNSDIFAQRVSNAGTPLWGEGGIPVCTASDGQFAPEIIADEAGGVIIAWHDYRSGAGEDIYAQRIDPQGSISWLEDGVPISTADGTQWYPKIVSDGEGGAIVVWTDGRNGSADNNIYAQRIDISGRVLWEKDGIPICTALHNQENPLIISDKEGAIIGWNDSRSGNIDIYLQKVDRQGRLFWQKDGVPACAFSYDQKNSDLAPDGESGAIVVWTDERVEKCDIYAQRIYADGRAAWQENGRPVCQAGEMQRNPKIVKLENKDWVIIWEDNRTGKTNLLAQRINNAGTSLWNPKGVPIASSLQPQESPAAIPASAGNIIVVWEDKRMGTSDIRSQKISKDGIPLWQDLGIIVSDAPGSVVQQNIGLAPNGEGEIILVFEDARSGYFNIYAQKINRAGNLAWGQHGIPIAKVSANQVNQRIVSDGKGGAIIAWEDHRIENLPRIRAQRISSRGEKLWESSISLADIKSRQINPLMISDGAGGAIIAWQDDRDVLSLQDIFAQRISAKGKLLWGKRGEIIISANGNQVDLAMIPDGTGGAFFTWTDFRRGERNPDIYAQRVNSSGKMLWFKEGVLVCGAPDIQRTPKLISDGEGGVVIAWTDKGGGSYDIYAQRLNKAGQPVWMKDGIPVSQLSRTQQNPRFGKRIILVWEDYRYGNWDIFADALDLSGNLIWGEEGMPVALVPHTQYAPQIISWKDGSVLIVWEDYRSGKEYEIFIQKLDDTGKPVWGENGIKIQSRDGGRDPRVYADFSDNSFYVFWEDYTGGGKAIYGQRYIID